MNYAIRSFSAKHKYFPKLFNSFTFLTDNKVTSLKKKNQTQSYKARL